MSPRKVMIRRSERGFIASLADIPNQPSEQIECVDIRSLADRLFSAGFRLETMTFPPFQLSQAEISEVRQEIVKRTVAHFDHALAVAKVEAAPEEAATLRETIWELLPKIGQLRTKGCTFKDIAQAMHKRGSGGVGLTGETLENIYNELSLEEQALELAAAEETLKRKLQEMDRLGLVLPGSAQHGVPKRAANRGVTLMDWRKWNRHPMRKPQG